MDHVSHILELKSVLFSFQTKQHGSLYPAYFPKQMKSQTCKYTLFLLIYFFLSSAVDCGPPPDLEQSEVTFTSTQLHAISNYTCVVGHVWTESTGIVLDNDTMVSECSTNGNWTQFSTTCLREHFQITIYSLHTDVFLSQVFDNLLVSIKLSCTAF